MRFTVHSTRSVSRIFVACLALAALLVAAWLVRRLSRGSTPEPDLGLLNLAPDVKYVEDQMCASCHEAISADYARTAMARSWHEPTPENIVEDYASLAEVVDAKLDLRYRAFFDKGRFFQEEFRLDSEGERIHSLVREVRYIIGSNEHGRSYVAEHNGYLTVLPLAWYSESQQWDLSPGYRRHNQRFGRPVPVQCVACHNSYPVHSGMTNRFQPPLPSGIGCQRCHGPGQLHVAYQSGELDRLPSSTSTGADPSIVNPARLPLDRRDDVCLQCHLQSDAAFPAQHESWTSFRPGQRLRDKRHDFFVQPEDPSAFGFSSHGPRLRLSRCWSEGETRGQLTCILCHDPHVPRGEVTVESYISKCLKCHAVQDCAPARASSERVSADCIACHMRKGNANNVGHVVFTDHWIRKRPDPLKPVDSDTAAVVQAPGRSLNMLDFWAGDSTPTNSSRAIALALFVYMNRRTPQGLAQAATELRQAERTDPNHSELAFWLGNILAARADWIAATRTYEQALRREPQNALTLFSLGEAHRSMGHLDQAARTFEKALAVAPDLLESYTRLAEIYRDQRNWNAAQGILRQVLALYPYEPMAQTVLAQVTVLAEGPTDHALAEIRHAIELNPTRPDVLCLEAAVRQQRGEIAQAIACYEYALKLEPRYGPAKTALDALVGSQEAR